MSLTASPTKASDHSYDEPNRIESGTGHEEGKTMDKFRYLTLSLLTVLALAPSAFAVDGVREINQTTVDALGGFPYRIQSPGSYRLTGNLEIPDADTTGIVIETEHVSLDLNGHSIRCASCSGTGSGDGIQAGPATANVAIRNGYVTGVGNRGISLEGFIGLVEDVRIGRTGGTGLALGENTILIDSQATHNGRGIEMARGSLALDSVASWNLGTGLQLNEFAVISGVTANENQGGGIVPTEGSVVIRSTANMNTGTGILSQESVIVESSAGANQGSGIECFQCLMARNTIAGNDGYGINAGNKSGYVGNMIRLNSSGELPNGAAHELGENVCTDTYGCP
jgi:hypothetical protein